VVIDAAVDTVWIQENHAEHVKAVGPDGIVHPDDLADNYVNLYKQARNAWIFELDVRPYCEKW